MVTDFSNGRSRAPSGGGEARATRAMALVRSPFSPHCSVLQHDGPVQVASSAHEVALGFRLAQLRHYGKTRICRVSDSLPCAFYRTHGKEALDRVHTR